MPLSPLSLRTSLKLSVLLFLLIQFKVINFTFLLGVQNQASNTIYQNNPLGCHKGDLYPAMTASGNPAITANNAACTYQFPNAMPQSGSFNTGQWRVWEGNIRYFARYVCIPTGGVLYLVTGISYAAIQNTQPKQATPVPIVLFAPGIQKPNSMWTAGACLYQNGECYTFAVIGNNVPHPPGMLTQEITQTDLSNILQFDIVTNCLKRDRSGRRSRIFPALGRCRSIRLPREEYPRRKVRKPPPKPPVPSRRPSKHQGSKQQGTKQHGSKHQRPSRSTCSRRPTGTG